MKTVGKIGAVALIAVLLISGVGLFWSGAGASGSTVRAGGANSAAKVSAGGGGGNGGCPSINAIDNFLPASNIGAMWTSNSTTSNYVFSSFVDENPAGGIPGLIQYCIYPEAGLPNSTTAVAIGADGSSFEAGFGTVQGYFDFGRSTGDPSNIGLDGTLDISIGTATWTFGAPSTQTILLHINDANTCNTLYNDGSQTCFVYPTNATPRLCNGDAVCKSIIVDEAYSQTPLTVPRDTLLHIHYTYVIVNQPTNGFDMTILARSSLLTYGMTGAKDAFTCLQIPDPSGTPGSEGVYKNYQGTSLVLNLGHNGGRCIKNLFTLTGGLNAVVLHPGESISFTVDMTTGSHGFPGHGTWCINAGVTLRWFESDDGVVHGFHSPMVDVTIV